MPAPVPVAQPSYSDPINLVDMGWLHQRAGQLVQELVAALPPAAQQRVVGIPLVFDNTPGDVNAFAACTDGKALIAITDELVRITAYLAQAKATDERFATHTVDQYIQFVATHQQQDQPLASPGQGFFAQAQQVDGYKVNRQHQILDEELGFILGHELGHHHMGHLPCTARPDALGVGEIARTLSGAVPVFNQPNEIAADIAGTNNLLSAGARHPANTYRYTENGALLTMQFFAGISSFSVSDLFGFERSHPAPQIRVPVIQQAAAVWRMTGGVGMPLPQLGG